MFIAIENGNNNQMTFMNNCWMKHHSNGINLKLRDNINVDFLVWDFYVFKIKIS